MTELLWNGGEGARSQWRGERRLAGRIAIFHLMRAERSGLPICCF